MPESGSGAKAMTDLYERDFFAWTQAQAEAIGRRDLDAMDWDNLQEEVRSIGSQLQSELSERLRTCLRGLIEWRLSGKWELEDVSDTMFNLGMVTEMLRTSPSLVTEYYQLFEDDLISVRMAVELRSGTGSTDKLSFFTASQLIDPRYNIYAWGRSESQAA